MASPLAILRGKFKKIFYNSETHGRYDVLICGTWYQDYFGEQLSMDALMDKVTMGEIRN